jgi:calcineurin-like phosphoesterase family protein
MKIKSDNIWFTSDTHYSHQNICKGVTKWPIETEAQLDQVRDFPDLDVMNKAIVDGINDNVEENDWLIHCGDWSFGGFDKVSLLREQINCKNIILLIGNHDHHIESNKNDVQKLFTRVSHYLELGIGDKKYKKIIVCHYPIVSWNGMTQGNYMIHGHQHLKRERRYGNGKRFDVGLCGSLEFRPYHIDEIHALIEDRPIYEVVGHHDKEVKNSLNPYNLQ